MPPQRTWQGQLAAHPSHPGTRRRALNSLAHPVTLAAMLVLLLNALVLQPYAPSGWSGKLGDAMWLLVLPFLVAWVGASVVPDERAAGRVALAVTGIGFALVKTVPALNALVAGAFTWATGAPLKLALDPTDLLVLPALGIAGWVWNRPAARSPRRLTSLAAVALAAIALAADMPAPQNLGLVCFAQQGMTLQAFSKTRQGREFGSPDEYYSAYASEDGGQHWKAVALSDVSGKAALPSATPAKEKETVDPCQARAHPTSWVLRDPERSGVQYAFLEGQGIYRSDDAGKTLRLERPLANDERVVDAIIDAITRNVVVALAGGRQVWLRTNDGQWITVPVVTAPY